MTKLLKEVVLRLEALPEADQDLLAGRWLAELADAAGRNKALGKAPMSSPNLNRGQNLEPQAELPEEFLLRLRRAEAEVQLLVERVARLESPS